VKIKFLKMLLFFFNFHLIFGGFSGDTLVKVPGGYTPICELRVGDAVISYNFETSQLCTRKVLHVSYNTYIEYHKLIFYNAHQLNLALDQKLFVYDLGWLESYKLMRGVHLGYNEKSKIIHSEIIYENIKLYELSIEEDQNFFVTHDDVLAHNVVFALGVVMGFEVAVDISLPLIVYVGAWAGSKIFGRSNNLEIKPPNDNDWNHILNNKNHGFNGGNGNNNHNYSNFLWRLAEVIISKSIADGKITDGNLYKVAGETGNGVLEITGKVVDGIVHIGTMYFKGP
jgi:hypothetical protein